MVPLLDDPNRPWKEAAFSQYKKGHLTAISIRSGKWRYGEWIDRSRDRIVARELYDHAEGPLADRNVAKQAENAEVVERFSRLMGKGNGWRAIKKELERRSLAAPDSVPFSTARDPRRSEGED